MDPVEAYRMPLMEHLMELRTRVVRSLVAIIVTFFIGFAVSQKVFDLLVAPMNAALLQTGGGGIMAVTDASEGFMVQMKVAGLVAAFLASPVIFWQVWGFISPGLYDKEKGWVPPLVLSSTTLFLLGGSFAYFVVFPFGFPVMLSVSGENVKAVLSIDKYLTFSTTIMLAFGLSFQLPVVVWVLARLGLIDHIDMLRGFRYSIVAIFVVAAVLTPPDWFDQVLMAIPLVLLYILGIGVAWMSTTKKREPEEASSAAEG